MVIAAGVTAYCLYFVSLRPIDNVFVARRLPYVSQHFKSPFAHQDATHKGCYE